VAYFAELDENNVVLRVVAVSDNELRNNVGQESEELGVEFCNGLLGQGNWLQTSYNGRIRTNFAGVGFTYDADRDAFIPPPYENFPSFVLDEDTLTWVNPVPEPTEDRDLYQWSEEDLSWVLKTNPPPQQ
tara:strand:- start:676 stop:1065 length:390 start_codon:yes stop_codon:yes gene_type:complete